MKDKQPTAGSRLLLLALAIVVPAVALIGFSLAHLKSLQRDHAVEASIQRQFQQMLAQANFSRVHILEEDLGFEISMTK